MKKIAIVIFIILGCNIFIGKAQERGFQISGKIDGILERPLKNVLTLTICKLARDIQPVFGEYLTKYSLI